MVFFVWDQVPPRVLVHELEGIQILSTIPGFNALPSVYTFVPTTFQKYFTNMRFSSTLAIASFASVALAAPASPTVTDTIDIYAAQAIALTESPTSKFKGKAFDRYMSIWLKNTDYDQAAADRKGLCSLRLEDISWPYVKQFSQLMPRKASS